MQFKILPITANLNVGFNSDMKDVSINGAGMTLKNFDINSIANSFLFLLMTQGLFAGLVIGKIAEGSIKAGIKHSIILIVLAFLISTGAQAIFG
jgi:flagellar protein FlaJ